MNAAVRIIHNQKVLMTEQEYSDYDNICRSYDRPNFKGDDLFKGLFHTDNIGMITKIGIPSGHQVSMEVFLFVCALYEHQKMRMWEDKVEAFLSNAEKRLASLEKQ